MRFVLSPRDSSSDKANFVFYLLIEIVPTFHTLTLWFKHFRFGNLVTMTFVLTSLKIKNLVFVKKIINNHFN